MDKHRTKIAASVISIILLLSLILVSVVSAAPPEPLEEGLPIIELPAAALSVSANDLSTTQSVSKRHPKMDSVLAQLAETARISGARALEQASAQSMTISEGRVHVQVTTRATGLAKAIEAIEAAGGKVTKTGYNDTLIQCWLPVYALETVAANKDVLYIRQPQRAVALEGAYTTEGITPINASAWHSAGFDGAGVRIAIIDAGFLGYPYLLGTELPANVTVRNFVDDEDDEDVNGTMPHGTACAEIIHDLAPSAELYLVKIATDLDLEEAVEWLITQQVDIISTSLGWINATPGDGTGFFADLVDEATSNDILWITAAGNYREAHWGGAYNDPDEDGFHDFNIDQEINYFGPGDGNAFPVPPDVTLLAAVRWDDWDVVDQDYDLVLFRLNLDDLTWEVVDVSNNEQSGQPGQTPTEAIMYTVPSDATPTAYGVGIYRQNATGSANFELFVPNMPPLDEFTYDRSLCNLADAPDAITVAAIDADSPYPQESYSSEGPTNGPGGTATGGAIKPDIAAYAGVSTACYGPRSLTGGLIGTSAAAPHVAGAAALVLSAYPGYTPTEARPFLEDGAIDMGPDGKDTIYGFGRLNLDDPPVIPPDEPDEPDEPEVPAVPEVPEPGSLMLMASGLLGLGGLTAFRARFRR